jgi:hypothetical protein
MRKYFDEAGQRLAPVAENPRRTPTAGQLEMLRHEASEHFCFGELISNELTILRFDNRLKVNRAQIAALFGEISALVKDVGDSTTHARGKISAASS